MPCPRLILASRSPRRAALLTEAGYRFDQAEPPFADPATPRRIDGRNAEEHAVELARLKAQSLLPTVAGDAVVLAADTICVAVDGELVGTPQTPAEALSMLRGFVGRAHEVVSGVALVRTSDQRWGFVADTATVTWGQISEATLAAYVGTEGWRGKAGGYNLFDRQRDRWPIRVDGDESAVVGLPMGRLVPALARLGVEPF